MTAALDARGLKRICMNCGERFYDMNKRPIVCPACSEEFTGEIKVKTRRSRATAVAEVTEELAKEKAAKQSDDTDIEEKDDDTVSLEDVKDDESDDDDDDLDLDLDADLENLDDIDSGEDDDDDTDDLDIKVVSDDED